MRVPFPAARITAFIRFQILNPKAAILNPQFFRAVTIENFRLRISDFRPIPDERTTDDEGGPDVSNFSLLTVDDHN
jgi:hypothetical protein